MVSTVNVLIQLIFFSYVDMDVDNLTCMMMKQRNYALKNFLHAKSFEFLQTTFFLTGGWKDGRTDGRTDGQTDGRTDGQTEGWTDSRSVGQ